MNADELLIHSWFVLDLCSRDSRSWHQILVSWSQGTKVTRSLLCWQPFIVFFFSWHYRDLIFCAWRLHPNTRNQAKGMLEECTRDRWRLWFASTRSIFQLLVHLSMVPHGLSLLWQFSFSWCMSWLLLQDLSHGRDAFIIKKCRERNVVLGFHETLLFQRLSWHETKPWSDLWISGIRNEMPGQTRRDLTDNRL